MKNILTITFLILVILTISCGTIFYFKYKNNVNKNIKIYHKTFNKKEVQNLIVNSDVLNISINENENNENIEISAQYNYSNQFSVNLKNSDLMINQFSVNSNENVNFNKVNEFINISLPKNIINKLQIKSAVGNISIKETLFNDLDLKSNIGNIKFTANNFPNSTNIVTDVGNIKITIPKPNDYIIKTHASVGSIKVYDNSKIRNFTESRGNEDKKIFIDSNVGNIKISQ